MHTFLGSGCPRSHLSDMIKQPLDSQKAESQQARLAALYKVSSRLGTTLDLAKLLNLVMDSIIELTNAERGYLVLRDAVTGELTTSAARGVDKQRIDSQEQQISSSIVEQVATTGKAVLTDNAQEDTRFSANQSIISYQLRSVMCAPLQTLGHSIGAIYVDNRLFSGVFAEDDLELLVAFANQAAIAIQNARLYTQTDRALARRVDELAIFQRIDQQLNKSLDLHEVLSSALHWAMVLTSADSGSIGLLEKADDAETEPTVLRLLVSQGNKHGELPHSVITQEHPVLAQVLDNGSAVLTHDVSVAQSLDGRSAAAQVAVPIQLDGHNRGLITLESKKAHFLDDEDLAFLERLADRAAVAIENARLYEEIQAAHQAKSDFVSMVTHEMRLPMTAIKGYADLMAGEMVGPLNSQQHDFLQVIQRNLSRMSSLIRDLSEINRLESGKMQFENEPFGLDEVVEDVMATIQEAVNGRSQTLAANIAPTLPLIFADPRRAGQILANLVSNAHKYTPEGGSITIQASHDEKMAHVSVRDTGVGISADDQTKLFSQFFRSESRFVRKQSGWGLGLYIVKRMVEAQGGEIRFASQEGQGTVFTFTLPLVVV